MKKLIIWIVKNVVKPRWVAFEYHDCEEIELGIMIFGVVIGLYKGGTIYPSDPKNIREPGKREFGESLHPM